MERIGAWVVTDEEVPIGQVAGRLIANLNVHTDGSLFIGQAVSDRKWIPPRDLGPLLYRNGKFYKLVEPKS